MQAMECDDDIAELQKLNSFIKSQEEDQVQDELFGVLHDGSDFEDEEVFAGNDEVEDEEVEDDDCLSAEIENDLKNLEGVYVYLPDSKEPVYLTNEENTAINSCKDPQLKHLLLLNRSKNNQLKATYKTVYKLYTQSNKKFEEAERKLNEKHSEKAFKRQHHKLWKLGSPYFKDKALKRCPVDQRTVEGDVEKRMVSYSVAHRWTLEDQTILRRCICFNYTELYKKQLQGKIALLKGCVRDQPEITADNRDIYDELEKAQKELNEIVWEHEKKVPPLNYAGDLEWETIAQIDLKGKHLVTECRTFWNIFLHPDINKSNWTEQENATIKQLAKDNNYQDWDRIAKELKTNRTAFIVCIHYFTALHVHFKRDRFTLEEDEQLIKAVEASRIGSYIPWVRVCTYFKHRSRRQLYHRYNYYLARDFKTGTFSTSEDVLLVWLVRRLGRNFRACAQHFPHRTSVQLRNRYSGYLQKPVTTGNFSLHEDRAILAYVREHGAHSYTTLANTLGRNRANVRHRYLKLKNWMIVNGKEDVTDVPRPLTRDPKKQNHVQFIYALADRFKEAKTVPTLEAIAEVAGSAEEQEANRGKRGWSALKQPIDVDMELLEFFMATCRASRERRVVAEETLKQTALDVAEVVQTLGATLDIPNDVELRERPELNRNDVTILAHMRDESARNDAIPFLPSTSSSSSSSNAVATLFHRDVSHTLIPTVGSILALRGLILQYNIYKNQLVKEKSSHDTEMMWRLEQHLRTLDEETRDDVMRSRAIFAKRMYALLKWPSILSTHYPPHLSSYLVRKETVPEAVPKQKRKVGRPPRQEKYKKCLQMITKRRKVTDPNLLRLMDANRASQNAVAAAVAAMGADADSEPDDLTQIAQLDEAIEQFAKPKNEVGPMEVDVWRSVENDLLNLEGNH